MHKRSKYELNSGFTAPTTCWLCNHENVGRIICEDCGSRIGPWPKRKKKEEVKNG